MLDECERIENAYDAASSSPPNDDDAERRALIQQLVVVLQKRVLYRERVRLGREAEKRARLRVPQKKPSEPFYIEWGARPDPPDPPWKNWGFPGPGGKWVWKHGYQPPPGMYGAPPDPPKQPQADPDVLSRWETQYKFRRGVLIVAVPLVAASAMILWPNEITRIVCAVSTIVAALILASALGDRHAWPKPLKPAGVRNALGAMIALGGAALIVAALAPLFQKPVGPPPDAAKIESAAIPVAPRPAHTSPPHHAAKRAPVKVATVPKRLPIMQPSAAPVVAAQPQAPAPAPTIAQVTLETLEVSAPQTNPGGLQLVVSVAFRNGAVDGDTFHMGKIFVGANNPTEDDALQAAARTVAGSATPSPATPITPYGRHTFSFNSSTLPASEWDAFRAGRRSLYAVGTIVVRGSNGAVSRTPFCVVSHGEANMQLCSVPVSGGGVPRVTRSQSGSAQEASTVSPALRASMRSQIVATIVGASNTDPATKIQLINAGPGIADHLRQWGVLILPNDPPFLIFNGSAEETQSENRALPGGGAELPFGAIMRVQRPNIPLNSPVSRVWIYYVYENAAHDVVEDDAAFFYDNDHWSGLRKEVLPQREQLLAIARKNCGTEALRRKATREH
jgi:hypothetical protein